MSTLKEEENIITVESTPHLKQNLESYLQHAPIVIWSFCDAPEHLQHLTSQGGDEDYILLARQYQDIPCCLEYSTYSNITIYNVDDDYIIYVYCHS